MVAYVGVSAPGAVSGPPAAILDDARAVGVGLGEAGAIVLCGGLDGAMEALAEGVDEAGGVCVGLLPGIERGAGSRFLTLAVATGLGQARNAVLATASDVLVALGGGFGTLSEIALALRLEKDVVALRSWPLDPDTPRLHRVSEPAEAVRLALRLAETRR